MMSGYGGGGWPTWAAALMWVAMLALLVVLIWAGYVYLTRAGRPETRDNAPGVHERSRRAARLVLDDRLARGDIDDAEYQRVRGLIADDDGHAAADA